MNCQMFSWGLSSGERGGSGKSEMLLGTLSACGAMPSGLIQEENGVGAGGDLGGDLVEMKLHGFGVAGRQHEGGTGSAFRAYRTEQIGGLGPLIVSWRGDVSPSWPSDR